MSTKKLVQSTEVTNTNSNGEITKSQNTKVFILPKEPAYIKLYLLDIERMYVLPDGTHRVIFELLKKLDYDGHINLNITVKRKIIKSIGWTNVGNLDNYISKHLINKEIFKKIGTGVFEPDPNLCGRGVWKDIHKRRNGWMKISYKNDKRVIKTNFTCLNYHLGSIKVTLSSSRSLNKGII